MTEPPRIVPVKGDKELADELRARLAVALTAVVDIMNEARASGLRLDGQIGRDDMGRALIMAISVSRPL